MIKTKIDRVADRPSSTIKKVGIIGGGQLAWMMADAAKSLGVSLIIQTPSKNDPAVAIAAETIFAPIDDATATAQLATRSDIITFENEFINLDALLPLTRQGLSFRPSLSVLKPLLDKYHQLCCLKDLGLPVPQFAKWEGRMSGPPLFKEGEMPGPPFSKEGETSGPPLFKGGGGGSSKMVIKTRRHGYDGQGTFIINNEAELKSLGEKLRGRSLLIQEFIPFVKELAVIAARSTTGEMAVFPVVETQQENEVCRRVIAPADLPPEVAGEVEAIARTLLTGLDVVGIFGIELFLTADGKILVNEIAPRTHNSGHFTLDACETSQFEQHLRAVCGLPLGSTALKSGGAVMVNLLGYEFAESDYLTQRQQIAEIKNASVWWYGKKEARPGRKLGHVTVLLDGDKAGEIRKEAEAKAKTIEMLWHSKK
jgi:5-(carboxyamino)imidazole ribonucleotide synthase